MMPYCMNCKFYTTEYQGKYTEFINYCREKKRQICLMDCGCKEWKEASKEQMSQRENVWNLWLMVQEKYK